MKIRDIFNTDHKLFFVVSGASLIFTKELQAFGGSSSHVLGVFQPNSPDLMSRLVGTQAKVVSEINAANMAYGVREMFHLNDEVIIVACTAALCKSDGERDGRVNEAYFTILHGEKIKNKHVKFDKINCADGIEITAGQISRISQETELSDSLLTFVCEYIDEVQKVS